MKSNLLNGVFKRDSVEALKETISALESQTQTIRADIAKCATRQREAAAAAVSVVDLGGLSENAEVAESSEVATSREAYNDATFEKATNEGQLEQNRLAIEETRKKLAAAVEREKQAARAKRIGDYRSLGKRRVELAVEAEKHFEKFAAALLEADSLGEELDDMTDEFSRETRGTTNSSSYRGFGRSNTRGRLHFFVSGLGLGNFFELKLPIFEKEPQSFVELEQDVVTWAQWSCGLIDEETRDERLKTPVNRRARLW